VVAPARRDQPSTDGILRAGAGAGGGAAAGAAALSCVPAMAAEVCSRPGGRAEVRSAPDDVCASATLPFAMAQRPDPPPWRLEDVAAVLAREVALEGHSGGCLVHTKTSRPRSALTATTLCSPGCALPRLWKLLDQAFGAPLDDNAKRCVWHAANSLAAAGDVHFTQYVPLHCASTKHATPVAFQAATGDASILRV